MNIEKQKVLEFLIISFFLFWTGASVVYLIDKSRLGQLSKILHRYGWLNEWSMYKYAATPKNKVVGYYRDMSSKNSKETWNLIEFTPGFEIKCLINMSGRINFFSQKCYQRILKGNTDSNGGNSADPVFDYFTAVVRQIPARRNSNYRQVKIELIETNGTVRELMRSNVIPIH